MEVQTCAFESPTITNSNYYYGKINICSVIMCFLIIYNTALSIVLSVKQLIQVIKEEELIKEMEDEEESMVKVDIQTQVIKEVVKVDVQTQVDKEEEEEEEEEEKDDSEDDSEDEDELLLANYRIKEREQALQEIYKERAEQAVEKWKVAYSNMVNYNIVNSLLPSHKSDNATVRLKACFERNTEYVNVNGEARSNSLKAAMNMIYRLETEEHLVKVEALARAEAVNAFKKIQFHIHFDFAFDNWSSVLKEEYYPQDALDIIKINKAHKLMTHL